MADIAIFATTFPQFMTPLFGNLTFGFNTGCMFVIGFAGLGILASPFQLRWGHRQIMSRIFMLSGGTTRLMGAFYPHAQTAAGVISDAVPFAVLLTGTVIYVKLSADDQFSAQMQVLREQHQHLDLISPFRVVNLFDEEVDLSELAAIAARIDKSKFYPMILHFRLRRIGKMLDDGIVKIDWQEVRRKSRESRVGGLFEKYAQKKLDSLNMVDICDPEEDSDFSIIGCSLTGYEFIICGRYPDSEENRVSFSKDLLLKLTKISIFNKHEINIRDVDLLSLNLEKERFPLSVHRGPFSFQMQIQVRLLWDKHVSRLDEIRREGSNFMHEYKGAKENVH